MTVGEQNRKDVPIPITELLSPKALIRVGCWNVRTLNQTGRLAQAVRELHHYNLTLMGVTEARWIGTGKHNFCHENDMVIGWTLFEHKDILKLT
ncbi:hypothetical protein ACJMK2_020048 [Sinanodonta woodiana]|uniref:Craniofacial development protein 2-like n=1 Tax=Sinanodonta woodiana TaxID=1069815 RepID=A0ABD3U0M8_SINWO